MVPAADVAQLGHFLDGSRRGLVRPIKAETGVIRCEGVVIHKGSRVVTAEGKVTDAGGKLLAHGTTTCLIFR